MTAQPTRPPVRMKAHTWIRKNGTRELAELIRRWKGNGRRFDLSTVEGFQDHAAVLYAYQLEEELADAWERIDAHAAAAQALRTFITTPAPKEATP